MSQASRLDSRAESRALVQINQNGTTGAQSQLYNMATLDNVNVNNLIIGSNSNVLV